MTINPHDYADAIQKSGRKKKFCIVHLSPENGLAVHFTSARNPYRRMLNLITTRGMSDELIIVNTDDLAILASYPPMLPLAGNEPSEVQP